MITPFFLFAQVDECNDNVNTGINQHHKLKKKSSYKMFSCAWNIFKVNVITTFSFLIHNNEFHILKQKKKKKNKQCF